MVRGRRQECDVTLSVFCRDVMEPVTYLSSLSMVILGYLWFVPHLRFTFGAI